MISASASPLLGHDPQTDLHFLPDVMSIVMFHLHALHQYIKHANNEQQQTSMKKKTHGAYLTP